MNKIKTKVARALNRGGVNTGVPKNSNSNKVAAELPLSCQQNAVNGSPKMLPEGFDGSFVPETWREERRRQTQAKYRRVMTEAVDAASQQARPRQSDHALSRWEWTPHLLAVVIAVLFVAGTVLLVGSHLLGTGAQKMSGRVDVFERQMPK